MSPPPALRSREAEAIEDTPLNSRPPADPHASQPSLSVPSRDSHRLIEIRSFVLTSLRASYIPCVASSRPAMRGPTTTAIDRRGTLLTKTSKSTPTESQRQDVSGSGRSYHISNGMKTSGVVSTIEAIEVFAREHGPGNYSVDQRYPDPFKGVGVISRPWGKAIIDACGKVTIHLEPIAIPGCPNGP